MNCPKDSCAGDEAAFYQIQIRSADEPMTGFYRVSGILFMMRGIGRRGRWLTRK